MASRYSRPSISPATAARAGSPVFPFLLAACGRRSGTSEETSRPVLFGWHSPGPCGARSLQACPSLLFLHSAWDTFGSRRPMAGRDERGGRVLDRRRFGHFAEIEAQVAGLLGE